MPALIRPLQPDDQDEWRRLWTGYLAFYQTTVPEAVYASTFARLLGSDPRDFSALVAERDGQLLGLTHYLFHRHCWKIEDVCYLQDLYVAPEARGTGLGRALIEAVYVMARERGCAKVHWLTHESNVTAQSLYDQLAVNEGFIQYVHAL